MLSDQVKKILARIDEGKRLLGAHGPLVDSLSPELHEQLLFDWIYNSNALEGNTLTAKETLLVLQKGETIGRKSVVEYLEVINHREAIGFVEEFAEDKGQIQERDICEINRMLLAQIDAKSGGCYRDSDGEVTDSSHSPPGASQVPELMAEFTRQHLGNSEAHPVCQAALAFFSLVAIQPFAKCNGPTALLLMNLMLMKEGYFPAIILKNDRQKYYTCLAKAYKGQLNDLIIFVARAVERTIYLYMEAIPGMTERFLSLTEAAIISPYSREYLNVLARRGAIPAFKLRRNWLISPEALDVYVASRGWISI
ncbi:MAG: Fic family protein [Proteobacteria bacterium]|nr:Fic family protein [Pseudomonadota bacterium]MBU1639161.1 Fic family protein [Pseudomonadota bacterium]